MKMHLVAAALFLAVSLQNAWALPDQVDTPQKTYESSIDAAVRNKLYYKASSVEFSLLGGTMPYDLTVNHYNLGGRVTWHITDHFAWEILDYQYLIPTVSSFTQDLVQDTTKNVQRLDVVKMKSIAMSTFLMSPFYGKFKFLGNHVIYFDMYTLLGLGAANTETVTYSVSNQNGTSQGSAWPLGFSFGLGIKLFMNSAMGLVIDFRDYVINSSAYDKAVLRSNYTVSVGLSFFIPPL
ncbi:MAG: outer membrane beta-barrel domain-containing protein [Deltaproteobacteria bacterium]|nr:outer membrane beta-barrel domain-containing protein [Deltaproteobacteria bacterium]